MPREASPGNCHILLRQDGPALEVEQFSPGYWEGGPGFDHRIGGRGGSCLIEIDSGKAVLRQYHRGGFVGNLLSNQYFWLGKNLTRPWREWRVLEYARQAGLPVPEPIAACACRTLFWYRAALVTAYLEDTEMLTQRLEREQLEPGLWRQLGALFRRVHEQGIRHADLTSDNVLIDSGNRFYLIDFDRARIMKRLDDWQWQPLYRFQRSMVKRNRNRALNYNESDWQALMDGYQS
ncbi:MAG: 3-deoxy-D-manno-octulosonic acid kinase [Gammaproteobacteria bacterium]|jgi:3-deoxy-D-manno-octulosonic acid kinase